MAASAPPNSHTQAYVLLMKYTTIFASVLIVMVLASLHADCCFNPLSNKTSDNPLKIARCGPGPVGALSREA